ncbi:hypothetical protein [Acinetobacter beijerinckii]|nr:hypothetical protein [Acinetobacter beijerinckii]
MKLENLEDDMIFKILALKNFCIGNYRGNKGIGSIEGIQPSINFNGGLDYLGEYMYHCDDYIIAELGTCKQFREYITGLEKINSILEDCPFLEACKSTNTLTGSIITECQIWWETNIDLIFKPHLLKDFFTSELEHLQFQAMHLKMLELFRFCAKFGFIQLATSKN